MSSWGWRAVEKKELLYVDEEKIKIITKSSTNTHKEGNGYAKYSLYVL